MAASASVEMRIAHPVIQRFFEISLYFMLFTGFAALAGTGKLDGSSVLVGLFALLVKGFLLIRRSSVLIPERWTNYLTLGYLFFFTLDYFLLSRSFLGSMVHMVLFAAIVKIFSVHRDRDFVYLAILSFGMVLTASVLTVDSLFFAIFCVFVLLAVMTFVSMEMRRTWIAAQPNVPSDPLKLRDLRRVPAALAGACALLVITIVIGTVALFFLVPRKPTGGYLSSFAARNGISTGFSEEVRLGEIGQIQQSSEVVMHVKFAAGTRVPADLRWRGIALTNFDGRKWSADPEEKLAMNVPTEEAILPSFRSLSDSAPGGEEVSYDVSLEPFGSRVFFVLRQPLAIKSRTRMIAIDSNGTIFNADAARAITDYSVVSRIPLPKPLERKEETREPINPHYLELPNYLDARISSLAERITSNEPTNFLKASAIEKYLSTNYGYTLQRSE